MTSLRDPRAILTGLGLLTALLCMLKRTDPIELLARWGYALRRAIYILGSMLSDAPGEARYRWVTQRPRDAAALQALAEQYPAGDEIAGREAR